MNQTNDRVMRKQLLLCAAVFLSGCSTQTVDIIPNAATSIQLDRPYKKGTPGEIPMRVVEVSPSFFLVTGRGGNSLAVHTEQGFILVDTKLMYPAAFAELQDLLEKETGTRKIHTVFLSHHHANHTGGNLFAKNAGAVLIAHENVSKILATYRSKIAPINPEQPSITFNDHFSTTIGGVHVEAKYFGPAHTSGDSVIVFPSAKIIAVGDLVSGDGAVAVDMLDGNGSLLGMLARLDDILKIDFELLVSGSGDNVLTRDEVALYRDRFAALVERGILAVQNGVPPQELRDAMDSPNLGFRLVGHFWTEGRFISEIHKELSNFSEIKGQR